MLLKDFLSASGELRVQPHADTVTLTLTSLARFPGAAKVRDKGQWLRFGEVTCEPLQGEVKGHAPVKGRREGDGVG